MSEFKKYYHATSKLYAYDIITNGFKISDEVWHGRALGDGVYVATKESSACIWGDIIFTCKVADGLKILWVDEDEYDKNIIKYLKKEFGNGIVAEGPEFQKAIPKNKKLTQEELKALCSHIYKMKRKGYRKKRHDKKYKWYDVSSMNSYIKRYGYDGIGRRDRDYWEDDELLVFNPANVQPVFAREVMEVCFNGDDIDKYKISDKILSINELKDIQIKERLELEEWEIDG